MRTLLVSLVLSCVSPLAHADDLEKARAYFQAGVDAYDQSKYEVALREFQHSHALSHNPALYFNMAACEEHLDHFQAASLLLRQYLIEKPDAEDRAKVETRIKTLEERDEMMKRPPAPPPEVNAPAPVAVTPPAPAPAPAPRRRVASWAMLGVTGALAVGAIAAGSWSLTRYNDLKSSCGMTAAGCSSSDKDAVHAGAIATDVLIGVGAAAAVTTLVLFIVEPRLRSHAASEHARVHLGPTGVTF
jgi:hypothetical protein